MAALCRMSFLFSLNSYIKTAVYNTFFLFSQQITYIYKQQFPLNYGKYLLLMINIILNA